MEMCEQEKREKERECVRMYPLKSGLSLKFSKNLCCLRATDYSRKEDFPDDLAC